MATLALNLLDSYALFPYSAAKRFAERRIFPIVKE
jgi:hypothetical protein